MASPSRNFHETKDRNVTSIRRLLAQPKYEYIFENFYHPAVGDLIERLNGRSLADMLDPRFLATLERPVVPPFTQNSFFTVFPDYELIPDSPVEVEGFPEKIDVSFGRPYANYNWELFYHFPLAIAVHLSKNQRFAEAQRWFHFIFDPTCNDLSVDAPKRFWKFIGFRTDEIPMQIDDVLALLSREPSGAESEAQKQIISGYQQLQQRPFQPHIVARTRPVSYQFNVIMKYLDNLIAWGDSLFRQDTIESINEAMLRYVLAANILGERPQPLPARNPKPRTFATLRESLLDEMGNRLVELEANFPFNYLSAGGQAEAGDEGSPLFGMGRTLYFCVPRNEKLLSYWDTVADRLFKIRNCMNIEGVVRQLALFDPPIDPGMLVKAAAAGIDIGSITNGLARTTGVVRAPVLIQKALELAGEVRAMGAALLSAIEKGDGERLALLRQGHEVNIQRMQQDIRFLQWKQTEEATKTLVASRASAYERYSYYLRLLGRTPDREAVPEMPPLPPVRLNEENYDEAYASLVGQFERTPPMQAYAPLALAGGATPAQQSGASGAGGLYLTATESAELNEHLPAARDLRLLAGASNVLAGVLTFIPNLNIELAFWGLGGSSMVFGGDKLADALKIASEVISLTASWEQDQAGIASRTASYERRAEDWALQVNLAARELAQMGRQLIGSIIAEQVAEHEYESVRKLITQSEETDVFMREKFSNEELYVWMQGELTRLYYEYYRFAFDTARKAEQVMKRELMRPEVDANDYIKFNYWDGGRKGLLSGEALQFDLKRMELAYLENNKREYELTKHVSLRQLNPMALLALKATGSCEVTVPEWLFDMDCPGHYMRRIKTVGVSIPSVVGPYTGINCTLSLLRSTVRTSSIGSYSREEDTEDARFQDHFGTVQSIVTSGANNDSGMFETNLRDERYLPFEGSGAESTWRIELPEPFRQFDYDSIADVILHVRYTARPGGDGLRQQATDNVEMLIQDADTSGLALLLSLPHDYPAEWHEFLNGQGALQIEVKDQHFSYLARGREIAIGEVQVHVMGGEGLKSKPVTEVTISDGTRTLTIPSDNDVLTRSGSPAFVLIQYSLS